MDAQERFMHWLETATRFLERGDSAWVIQVFVVILLTAIANAFQRIVLGRLEKRFGDIKAHWRCILIASVRRPLNALIWVLGIALAAEIIYRDTDAAIFSAVAPLRDVAVIACVTWFLSRLIQGGEAHVLQKRVINGQTVDPTTAVVVSRLLRISVIITAALVILQTLGFSISGVLAFGGIGGIAVGFAAQGLLANFFGALMIYLDRPFTIGDWIYSPDQDIEGTVEDIGWRLTRIRTFDQRPLYVPNSVFNTISVVNASRMKFRRIYESIGIRREDAEKLPAIMDDIRDMLRTHPEIAADQTLIVNFDRYGPSSLEFFIYTFTRTREWVRYHEVKQDVLLQVYRIITEHGAKVAYPTSTVHVPEALSLEEVHPSSRSERDQRAARRNAARDALPGTSGEP